MGKIYICASGKKYKVMSYMMANIKHARHDRKYHVYCLNGNRCERYEQSFYHNTPEEAEKELDTLATRRGWTVCS